MAVKAFKDAPCILKLQIYIPELSVRLLVDTGSTVEILKISACPPELLKKMIPVNVTVRSASTHRLNILGCIKGTYYLDGNPIETQIFLINDQDLEVACDGILSRVFLRDNNILFRGNNDKLKFKGKYYPLTYMHESDDVSATPKVIARTAVTLQANSMTHFQVSTFDQLTGEFLFKPEFQHRDILLIPSIHKMENDTKKLMICALNAGKCHVRIKRKTELGKLVPATVPNVFSLFQDETEYEKTAENVFSCDFRSSDLIDTEEDIVDLQKDKFDIERSVEESNIQDPDVKKKLLELLNKYKNVFWQEGQQLRMTNKFEAEINTEGHGPVWKKPYKTPQRLLEPLKKELDDLLSKGIIRPCQNSPYNSPCVLIEETKADGSKRYRLIIDFREINRLTVPAHTFFPDIISLVNKAQNAKLFSKIDLLRAFHQLPVKFDDQKKMSFSCEYGTYTYRSLAFGLRNSGIFFQMLMNQLLTNVDDFVSNLVDDLLIFSPDEPYDHLNKIEQVLAILEDANLTARLQKCKWMQPETTFIGYEISSTGYRPLAHKCEIIKNFPTPRTPKHIDQFLGTCTFYRRSIPRYTNIILPLLEAKKRDKKDFKWTPECQTAFDTLKKEVYKRSQLAYPQYNSPHPFKIYCDASNFSVGFALTQDQMQINPETNKEELMEVPLAFNSKTLDKAERNYETWRKELTSLLFAIKQNKYLLTNRRFIIYNDHRSLIYMASARKSKQVFDRYSMFLADYNYEVRYLPGDKNKCADSLSRLICDKGKIEYIPEHSGEKYVSFQEFLQKWETEGKYKAWKSNTIFKEEPDIMKKKNHASNNIQCLITKQDDTYGQEFSFDEFLKHWETDGKCKSWKLDLNNPQNNCLILKEDNGSENGNSEDESDPDSQEENILEAENRIIYSESENESRSEEESDDESVDDQASSETDEEINLSMQKKMFKSQLINTETNRIHSPLTVSDDTNGESADEGEYYIIDEFDETTKTDHDVIRSYVNATKIKLNDDSKLWEKEEIIPRKKISEEQHKDSDISKIIKILKNPEEKGKKVTDKYVYTEDHIVYKIRKNGKKIWIPKTLELPIIKAVHTSVYHSHPGIEKTYELLSEHAYFKGMRPKLADFIRDCHVCNISKPNKQPIRPPMKLQLPPSATWEQINADCLGPIRTLNQNNNHEYAIIFECRLSRWPEVITTPDITADTLISVFMTKIIPVHGLCKKLIFDSGPCFKSKQFRDFCQNLGIEVQPASKDYPQGNALAEFGVGSTKAFLRNLIAEHKTADWTKLIPYALSALRSCKNKATGFSPFQVMYNKPMILPVETNLPYRRYATEESDSNEQMGYWNLLWSTVRQNISKYHGKMKETFDRLKATPVNLKVGQKVYVKTKHRMLHFNKIYTPRFQGGFIIVELTDTNAILESLTEPGKRCLVHISKLKPVRKKISETEKEDPKNEQNEEENEVELRMEVNEQDCQDVPKPRSMPYNFRPRR